MNLQMEINSLKQRIAELENQAKEEREFPQEGDSFYSISETGNIEGGMIWGGYPVDMNRMAMGNIFKTKEQAEFAVEKLKVEAELRKFSRPFKEGEYNYFIQIHPSHNNIVVESDDFYQTQGTIYFESTAIANEATDTVGEDRIKKYLFGVEN